MQDIIGTGVRRHHDNLLQVFRSYYQLTKPRIILLLLMTTIAGMVLASHGRVDPVLALATVAGGAMAAASANTINCLYDCDIDYIMERTRSRPIPSGRVQPRDAALFAASLAIASFTLLATFANLLAALLAMSGIVFYVLIYTHFLKRHSTQNIVVGGAAGAIPPLVGWAAVTGELGWAPWVVFAIIFFWTPPHFWALAMMIRDDYAAVGVPMLPVIEGDEDTARQIWLYTLLLLPLTLLLVYPLHVSGAVYGATAIALGAIFARKAWQLLADPHDREKARSLFKYSISYLMLLCVAIALDCLPLSHHVTSTIAENLPQWLGAIGPM
jgi:protoheme IX farnesyltransferase